MSAAGAETSLSVDEAAEPVELRLVGIGGGAPWHACAGPRAAATRVLKRHSCNVGFLGASGSSLVRRGKTAFAPTRSFYRPGRGNLPVETMTPLAEAVEEALRGIPARRHIQSIVVARGGAVQLERYFRDRRSTDLSNVHSVTKSVLATLAGIAIADGSLSIGTTLADIFGDELFRGDERKREISVEQLLTMTAGLDADSPHDIDEIADRGESGLDGPLSAPLRAEPGTTFIYNNGAAHVLGIAIARTAGMPLARFAEQRLFRPLGINEYRWPTDPDGNPLGYGHLELRPRELLPLGQLYLDGGRCRGRALLPEWFVAAATTAHTAGGPPEGVPYGYLWWITEDGGYRSFFAGGFGGQYLTIVPELALVVVTTGDVDVIIETSRNLRRLVSDIVVPAMAD